MELVRHGMRGGESTGTIGPGGNRREEVASMQHADTIKYILRHLECKPEVIIRVPCLFCHNGRALLLVPSTGQYECQICGRYGKLDSLAVLAAESHMGGTITAATGPSALVEIGERRWRACNMQIPSSTSFGT